MSKRQRGERTREEIVAVCLKLFARRGFHNTSISEIAKTLRLTKGAIYWHFESKEALFVAILDKIKRDWQATVLRQVNSAEAPNQKIEQLFDSYLLLLSREPEVCLFLQRVVLEANDKYLNQITDVSRRTVNFIAGIFEQGKERGIFKRNIDSKLLAHMIISCLAGAQIHSLAVRDLSLADLIKEIKRTVIECSMVEAGKIKELVFSK